MRPSQLRPDGVRTQVDARCARAVDSSAFQEVQEVFLARLPEGEPVEGEVILEGHDFGGIPAERYGGSAARGLISGTSTAINVSDQP